MARKLIIRKPLLSVHETIRRLRAGDRSPELLQGPIGSEQISIAEEELKKGYRVSYMDTENYGNDIILEYPDGHRQLGTIDDEGNEVIIRDIPPIDPPREWLQKRARKKAAEPSALAQKTITAVDS